jgi:altronate dehydratase
VSGQGNVPQPSWEILMTDAVQFDTVARIPSPGDNVAITTRRVEKGTQVTYQGAAFEISHTILEGHRFALGSINTGDTLLSWGLPFGLAVCDIAPGTYVCNEKIIRALRGRHVDFDLPSEHNFNDHIKRYELNEATFVPGEQVPAFEIPGTFEGFARSGGRGVGTRNYIVILATNSPSSGMARELATRLEPLVAAMPNIDGVVAVTHTEGGGQTAPNNLDYVLRTLGGFIVHPNVGAVLALDHRGTGINNDILQDFMREKGYPLADVLHEFTSIESDFDSCLDWASDKVTSWLPEVSKYSRTEQPLSGLKLALQCGGSDAFSGVSGNALAGWVSKTLVRHGGAANLAETDELIGAEPYVLANVRNLDTAKAFLNKIENFKTYASHHGTTAEGNPSGGNNYRGLYNIALKSIGAARKKDPDVRLDFVIDYAQPMNEGGYYFMDSPGNDLESIAGQVAAGSNLILFITGNGSITNFPFVPTLKFVTTTGRFELLANEMDVNAGRYNDGLSMDALGEETFELARSVASGTRSKGELAGHSQVSIWRDWPQTDTSKIEQIKAAPKPTGAALASPPGRAATFHYDAIATERGFAIAQVGLVMPTSLCSGQPARVIAEHLNTSRSAHDGNQKYVALVHTEGCGSNNTAPIFLQTMLGHLEHRAVRNAILLEHGCEQTHNDTVKQYLDHRGVGTDRFGWASVQLDGGLERVRNKISEQFGAMTGASASARQSVNAGEISLALTATGELSDATGTLLGELARALAGAGATVVIPANATLLLSAAFRSAALTEAGDVTPSLAYGQVADERGLHIMETPTENVTETFTGLGATGVDLMLCHTGARPVQAHPMLPLLQISTVADVISRYERDLDLTLDGSADNLSGAEAIYNLIAKTASATYQPKLFTRGVTEFQLTRGLLGLSM